MSLRSVSRVAAFFDLDRTLMAGSSGMHFARAAYRSGMVSRARLARWGVEHVRFRLRGSTDERTAQAGGYNSTPTLVVQGPKGQAQPIQGVVDYPTLEAADKSVE